MIRFRTDFEKKRGTTETMSLDREGDSWKVLGLISSEGGASRVRHSPRS